MKDVSSAFLRQVALNRKMHEDICKIQFDPTFVEEAVFLFIRSQAESFLAEDYHIQRENIYQQDDSSTREFAFRELHTCYFVKFGLRDIFEKPFRAFPLLANRNFFIFVKRVFSKKDEGSQLFVRGHVRTASIGLQVIRILEQTFLKTFLYHELLRVADMLDSRFQYSPDIQFLGENEIENNLIRDRFRFLWDLYIDARLKKMDDIPAIYLEKKREIFCHLFSRLKPSMVEAIYSRLVEDEKLTQSDLLGYAKRHGMLAGCS